MTHGTGSGGLTTLRAGHARTDLLPSDLATLATHVMGAAATVPPERLLVVTVAALTATRSGPRSGPETPSSWTARVQPS